MRMIFRVILSPFVVFGGLFISYWLWEHGYMSYPAWFFLAGYLSALLGEIIDPFRG